MNTSVRWIYSLSAIAAIVGTIYFLSTNPGYLILFYITLGHLALGAMVLSFNYRNKINISYAFLVFFTGGMVLSSAVFYEAQATANIILGARFIYLNTFLLMIPLFYFSTFFPFDKPKLSRLQQILVPLPGITLALISLFSDLMVRDFATKYWGREVVFGPLFPIFGIYCLAFVAYSFYVLIDKLRFSSGLQKVQIRYIFLSFLIIGVPAFTANIILPAMFNYYGFIRPALYFALPEAALVAYAILRHRLMSIGIVLQRGIIYVFLAISIMAIYASIIFFSSQYLQGLTLYNFLYATGLAAVIIALSYQLLFKALQFTTDRIFFRGHYDYQRTLRDVSSQIATKIRLEELSRLIVTTFIDTMGVSEISFLIYHQERGKYRSVSLELDHAGASRYKRIEVDEKSPIVNWLKQNRDILLCDEQREEGSVKDELEKLGVAVWVPIISKEKLIGIISLGSKLSGDIYSYEDIALLFTLANQSAVALENSALYGEVLEAKDYIQKIMHSISIGVLTIDARGMIVTLNPMAERITGFAAREMVGKNFKEVFSPKSAIVNLLERALNGKIVKNQEAHIVSKALGLVPVSASTTELLDPKGKSAGAVLSFVDMTEVKQLEDKVRQADKIKALGTLAAGMAHEIKNPLSSMKVLSQLLPLKYQDEEFRGKLMEILPKEIGRIDRIVESLLGFARSTSPKFTSLNIEELIEDNLKYYSDQAQRSGVKVIKQYAALPPIEGDKDQLSQVFSNLILNAIQAMPEGGQLNIKTREGKKTENILETLKIEISDSGHGIPEENLRHLFDPFFTTKYAGTGLGLTISHSIIDGHRGLIDVDSKIGSGTTFTITLPVKQELL